MHGVLVIVIDVIVIVCRTATYIYLQLVYILYGVVVGPGSIIILYRITGNFNVVKFWQNRHNMLLANLIFGDLYMHSVMCMYAGQEIDDFFIWRLTLKSQNYNHCQTFLLHGTRSLLGQTTSMYIGSQQSIMNMREESRLSLVFHL